MAAVSRTLRGTFWEPSTGTILCYLEIDYTFEHTATQNKYAFTAIRARDPSIGSQHTVTLDIKVHGSTATSCTISSSSSTQWTEKALTSQKAVTLTHSSQGDALSVAGSGKNTTYGYSYTGCTLVDVTGNSADGPKDSYTVMYSANNGTGAPSSQTKWHGEPLTLSAVRPTRTGYRFGHWNTKNDGTGTRYAPSASFTTNATTTLYAIWNPIVTYDANGGSGAPQPQEKQFGQSLTLSQSKPTRTGYVFRRWNRNTDDSGSGYNPGGQVEASLNVPITLYAIWNPIVTYDANGGTGAPSNQVKTYGVALTLSSATPTRAGHRFIGWSLDKTTKYLDAGGTVPASSNDPMRLYALWRRVTSQPTISAMSVVRCDSEGSDDDEGTYFRLAATWAVDRSVEISNTGTVTAEWRRSGTSTWTSITLAEGASGASGTARSVVAGADTDSQYDVRVTVTDSGDRETTRTDILTTSKFLVDFRVGGRGIGFGAAAPSPTAQQNPRIRVGWDLQLDEDMSVAGDLAVTGDLSAPQLTRARTTSGVATDASGSLFTVDTAKADVYGKLVMLEIWLKALQDVAAGSMPTTSVATIAAEFRPALDQGFGNRVGYGYVTNGGLIYLTINHAVQRNGKVLVGITYLKS